MDDLVAFLSARLDEDEAAARKAASADRRFGGRPHWSALGHGIVTDATDPDWAVADLGPCIDDDTLAEHITRHDPARVLREVAADREVLRAYEASVRSVGEGLSRSLRNLVLWRAAVYSDHPDYRPEWAPHG